MHGPPVFSILGVFVNIDRVADVWTEAQWRTDLTAMKAVGIEFFVVHHVARATARPSLLVSLSSLLYGETGY